MEELTLFDEPGERTRNGQLAPLLKWPGGKSGELSQIMAAAPKKFDRYFEPFVGGGAVYWTVPPAVPAFINDASSDLMDLYRFVKWQDPDLFAHLEAITRWWRATTQLVEQYGQGLVELFVSTREDTGVDLSEEALVLVKEELRDYVDLVPVEWDELRSEFEKCVISGVPRKVARMRSVETKRGQELPLEDVWSNIEGAYLAAIYTTLRSAYNRGRLGGRQDGRQTSLFFFLRDYCYAAMFRFNASGEFNVPYGGITYNRKDFASKVEHLRSSSVLSRLENTTMGCGDFEDFLNAHPPERDDWMFLDPPYDSDFSDYDELSFSQAEHERLARVMRQVDCKLMLVIKATPAVRRLYSHDAWDIVAFDKKYMWTIKERNDRDATHLMITNYSRAPQAVSGASGVASDGGSS